MGNISIPIVLMFILAFGYLTFQKKFAAEYICIFMVPFQSMSLIYLVPVTTHLISVQLCFLLMFIMRFSNIVSFLRRDIFFICCIIFSPMVISYIWNMFFFVPVRGWETDAALRGSLRTSLNMSNITQLVYVIFGLAIFWVFSSIKLDLNKVVKILDASIFIVVGAGVFQVVSHYGGFFHLYELFFYNMGLGMQEQLMGRWKRINSTFVEPSYFGFWGSFTLFFYLTCFGLRAFIQSWAVRALFVCGVFSTTTTFYAGLCFLLVIMYFFYSTGREKILIYSLGALLFPLGLYFLSDDVMQYYNSKAGSTGLRTAYGIDLAWEAFWTSPVFGKAYGTIKAFFIHTQMLAAVGIVGVIIILIGLGILMVRHRSIMIYLICVILLGFGNFEFTRPEMWLYLGLLANPYIIKQVEQRELEGQQKYYNSV